MVMAARDEGLIDDTKGGIMAEHPEEKQNSNGLFALCAGALIGVLNGIFIGWIIWG